MRKEVLMFILLLGFSSVFGQWATNRPANMVIGQTDFATKTSGSGADKFNGPNGLAIDPTTNKLFVVDRANNRILRFAGLDDLSTGSAAEAVIGQPDFTTTSSGLDSLKFNTPINCMVDQTGTLWVGDFGNNRVLRFDNISADGNYPVADGVLGQPDFVTKTAATSQTGMNGPVGLFCDLNGTLWVTNYSNHRVLRFDQAVAKANGDSADGVLGQPDFITGSSGLSASKMNNPNSLFMGADGRLWVSEYTNRRVLRFDDAANKANGAEADGVLGQENFTSNVSAVTQDGMSNLRYVTGDAFGRIYVVGESNNRVLIFNEAASKTNGDSADYVLGQADFVSKLNPTPPTETSLNVPRAAIFDETGRNLWVADWSNNRVLRYSEFDFGNPDVSEALTWEDGQSANIVLGQTDYTTGTSGLSDSKFNTPQAICYHQPSGTLFVSDRLNNRVLRYDSLAALTSGSPASAVFGQPDFVTNSAAVTAAKMNTPIGLAIEDDGTLWVGDYGNKRVLRFDDALGFYDLLR